ncbi:MAG TPA: NmrA family NAD(P)-binding protein, partial [Ktedonobacteraceae bacterium]|nr:NmrA family NAD(P)-binding protein [Ktedonobacteraceae bacterium]
SLRTVTDGVDRIYFSYPIDPRHLEAATNMAVAAREAGVETLVNNSLMPARADHPSPEARQHWLAERIFDWAAIGAIHVRGAFFYENLLRWAAGGVTATGELRLPFGEGDGKVFWVAAEDIARVDAAILANPDPHRGQTYNIAGPDLLTHNEIATLFGRVLERPVAYVDIPVEQWREDLVTLEGPHPHLIEHLSCLAYEFRQRARVDGIRTVTVKQITGVEPLSLKAYLVQHKGALFQQ